MASIRSLASVSQNIFVSAHLDGQICLWDLRAEAESSRPAFSCRVTDCFQGATSLASHPAEPNLVSFSTFDIFLEVMNNKYLDNMLLIFLGKFV